MRPEDLKQPGFIRRHCGSVAPEAPSDRATGAQRPVRPGRRSIFKGISVRSNHPAGHAVPSGTCLLRVFNL
jgi:hypothetical protein